MLTMHPFSGPRVASGVMLPTQELVEDMSEILATNVRLVSTQRVPLSRVADAHAALKSGPQGTVVVEG